MKLKLFIAAGLLTLAGTVSASFFNYQRAYEATPPGQVQVKVLPPVKAIQAVSSAPYFDRDDQLFMQLFRYIDRNEIPMTVPVEAEIKPGAMRFFVGPEYVDKAVQEAGGVEVIDLPSRTVASVGIRGRYSEDKYRQARAQLYDWIAQQPKIRMISEPYMVYWNGPFTPGFMKKAELHVEITELSRL